MSGIVNLGSGVQGASIGAFGREPRRTIWMASRTPKSLPSVADYHVKVGNARGNPHRTIVRFANPGSGREPDLAQGVRRAWRQLPLPPALFARQPFGTKISLTTSAVGASAAIVVTTHPPFGS